MGSSSYLIISIIFATAFACFYKVAVRKGCTLSNVNVWVYLGSTSTILAYALISGSLRLNLHAELIGVGTGTMVFFSTLAFFYHMRYGKLAASWTVIALAVSFPVVASMLIWHEQPSMKQSIGLVLIAAALILFGRHEVNAAGGDR